jgi:Ca-activated chloride channel family protein
VLDVEGATTESGGSVSRVYPKEVYDLFAGEQLVMVGRYKKAGAAKVTITGKVGMEDKKLDFPANMVASSGDQSYAFIEKLWAMRRIGEIIDQIDLNGKNNELVKELVELSTKHGILTPYTSFLADDQNMPRLADLRAGRGLEQANRAVDQLSLADGISGVAQRAEKKSLQKADNLDRRESEERGAGGAGGFRAKAAAAAPGASTYRDIAKDEAVVTDNVVEAGGKALYRRNKTLVAENATDIDPEKDSAKLKEVKRFSDEYFALVKDNSKAENAMLARQREGEDLIIKLRGQAYRIR